MKKKEAYLGLDLGGTGAKAGVFDRSGKLLGFGHRPFEPDVSDQGHVEIPIGDIYTAARDAVCQAVQQSRARVLAMAVSSQGETFVSLDENDKPLHRAIVWYDSRAGEQAERLKSMCLPARPQTSSGTGTRWQPWRRQAERDSMLLIDAIATAPKIMWLRDHFPDLVQKARRFLLLPDYMAYRLTGRAATDWNTASSTALYEEDASGYDQLALASAGIEQEQMSEILPPGSPVANVSESMADEWGLSPDTLLVTGTNDQYAGALGAGNCRPGILSETTGTCLALVTLTEKLPDPLPDGMLGGRFPITRYQFALAYSKTAGVVLDWFRRECCGGADFKELNEMAASIPVGSRGLTMVPHFDGMISPAPDPRVRGVFCYLTLRHTRADMYRSILEALTFSLYENIEFLEKHGLRMNIMRSIGGGAKSDLWLQMKADVIGMPVEKPVVTDAAMLGAAMLAASGHGDFQSLAESSEAFYRPQCIFDPDPGNRGAYDEPYKRYRDLMARLRDCWDRSEKK